MAGGMKILAKETAIYGMSSIIGRFLNWLLVPMYVRTLSEADNGIYSNIYAYTALILVLLTYGMETGFFRFMNKEGNNSKTVYSTTLISLLTTSLLFILLCWIFVDPISSFLGFSNHSDYILIMAIVVGIDAFLTIPFAYLRYKKMPIRFMTLRLINIFVTIGLNIFFLILCPVIYTSSPGLINWFYDPNYGVGYVFVANLIGTLLTLCLLLPYFAGFKYQFDKSLLRQMLKYSFPLLILGIAGILDQSVDKMLFPHLFEDKQEGFRQLGIYSACFKMGVIMSMFTQAFRYAYEPFVFSQKATDDKKPYSEAMKYFIIFSLVIFLGVMFYIDILKHFLVKSYFEGLPVVPLVLIGYIFFGIYFNLSFWYKLTDKTYYGAIFSIVGCVIIIALNILFVPVYGYMASAWAFLICNLVMMLLSFYFGQKEYPIPYDLKSIGLYFGIAAILYAIGFYLPIENIYFRLSFRTFLLLLFFVIIIKKDLPLSELKKLKELIKRK